MSSTAIAVTVSIASACISLVGLLWNLTLFRLSGARLQVRLTPAAFTAQGNLMRGPDGGWRKPIPESMAKAVDDNPYVDLAIIKVTNIGRSPVSVSEISLDFGRSGWRPGSRHTVGGVPIPVHECRKFRGQRRRSGKEDLRAVKIRREPSEGMSLELRVIAATDASLGCGIARHRNGILRRPTGAYRG